MIFILIYIFLIPIQSSTGIHCKKKIPNIQKKFFFYLNQSEQFDKPILSFSSAIYDDYGKLYNIYKIKNKKLFRTSLLI